MLSTLQEPKSLTPAATSDRSCEHQHHSLWQDVTLHHTADDLCVVLSLFPECCGSTMRTMSGSPQNARHLQQNFSHIFGCACACLHRPLKPACLALGKPCIIVIFSSAQGAIRERCLSQVAMIACWRLCETVQRKVSPAKHGRHNIDIDGLLERGVITC